MDKTWYNPDANWRRLRNAIIQRAVTDYKLLIKGEQEPTRSCNLIEIEKFFLSKKCDDFLADFDHCSGETILQGLKKWEEQYYASRGNEESDE